jgi:hypothetical protein
MGKATIRDYSTEKLKENDFYRYFKKIYPDRQPSRIKLSERITAKEEAVISYLQSGEVSSLHTYSI